MKKIGGEAGIRTRGTEYIPYNGLAIRRFRPLSHLSAISRPRTSFPRAPDYDRGIAAPQAFRHALSSPGRRTLLTFQIARATIRTRFTDPQSSGKSSAVDGSSGGRKPVHGAGSSSRKVPESDCPGKAVRGFSLDWFSIGLVFHWAGFLLDECLLVASDTPSDRPESCLNYAPISWFEG